MKGGMGEYLADFVPCLENILNSADIDKKMKLPALHALGAMSLSAGGQFNDYYLSNLLNILSQAAQMSANAVEIAEADAETKTYLQELRMEVLDDFASAMIALGEEPNLQRANTWR